MAITLPAGVKLTAARLALLLPVDARKVADESRASTTTLANDAELTLTVTTNAVYALDAYILYSQNIAAGAANGIKLGWTAPAGAALQWTSGGTDGPTSLTGHDVTSQTIAGTRNLPANLGTWMSARSRGTLTTGGTAGLFALQWAQVGASATPTLVRAGSWITLRRLA